MRVSATTHATITTKTERPASLHKAAPIPKHTLPESHTLLDRLVPPAMALQRHTIARSPKAVTKISGRPGRKSACNLIGRQANQIIASAAELGPDDLART